MSIETFVLIQLLNVLCMLGFSLLGYILGHRDALRDAERKQKMLMNYKKEINND